MDFSDIIKKFPSQDSLSNSPRPYINHSIELKKEYTASQRAAMLEKVGLNVFFFPSEMITGCDFLSDSGTTTMTNKQWAALHLGDESYGSNRGYFLLREVILKTFGKGFFNLPQKGKPNAFLFHQGRPCEDALFSMLGRTGKNLLIPSNGHFDTTEANIEASGITATNLFSSEFKSSSSKSHFKGNMNIKKLKKLLEKSADRIPLIYITITNNTGGGQPVSMENIREVHNLSRKYNKPLFFDACRFAENAWFIKKFEKGYSEKSISEIVKTMFSFVDGFTISFKKDGLVNMGGGLFLRENGLFIKEHPKIPDALMNYQIIKEGHPTYGGLSGRDIMTLVKGLETVVEEKYLDYRINQVREFGEYMNRLDIPVVMPIGGHAVYLDVNRFFKDTNMKPSDYAGISLTAILLASFGHRACELGYFAFGSFNKKTGEDVFPEVNFVRFAVPRLRYERQDLFSAADAVKALFDRREIIPSVKVIYGKDLPLRHFKARFRFNNT